MVITNDIVVVKENYEPSSMRKGFESLSPPSTMGLIDDNREAIKVGV
jgi:hypothetical protein